MTVKKNILEWTVFTASLLLVVGCVAVLIVGAKRTGSEPAELVVAVGASQKVSSGFRVEVVVRNEGDGTAEGVRVELALMSEGGEVETGELSMAFVPRQSKRSGFIVFQNDPRCCKVVTSSLSFENP